ncbi:hypothetical protein SteCoe_32417 [Stentor coeruleus]|uniref:Major facilitator superfamily (MFS) profile domain-containing protein n=1 Tax=Stentor coeruleus TaxID=5963 RepID=A0A1R2AZ18_9CILI|nr:hypothetical protein SteCoe_32417 [Stentor coeruleus]
MVNRKILTVLGCALTHFTVGTIYCTGNIMPYVTSYIFLKDESVTMASMTIVFYICILTYALAFQISNLIQIKYTPKKCIYAGAALYIVVVFVTAACQNRIAVIIIYGILLGAASGTAYPAALMIAISCYPERKGLVTGIVVGSFAVGAFVFNFIATAIVNPSNIKPYSKTVSGGKTEKFFERSVAENVPEMFLILAAIYTVLLTIALFLVQDIDVKAANLAASNAPKPPIINHDSEKPKKSKKGTTEDSNHLKVNHDEDDADSSSEHSESHDASENSSMEEHNEPEKKVEYKRIQTFIVNEDLNLTPLDALKTKQFHQIFWCFILSGTAGLFAVASFKTIGIKYGYDDTFLTVTGSLGSILNGTMRPLWGMFFDKTNFRMVYLVILCTQICICVTFPEVSKFKPAFLIWLVILFVCSGGHFTLLAPTAVRIYSRATGSKVYTYFIIAMGLASITVYFIQVYATVKIDPSYFFYILAGLSGISLVSTIFFTEIIKVD